MTDRIGVSGSTAPLSTSSGLLELVRARDPAGWRRLADLYGPLVYGWSRQCGLQPDDAADMTQDVFTAVWRNLDGFRHDGPGDSFRGWLWTVTRNKVRDHFRRRATQPTAYGGSDAQGQWEQLQTSLIDESSQCLPDGTAAELARRALERVRAEFEPRTWQAFWQTAVEDRQPADVAADLGMSVGAVYMAKSRVLRRIRAELA